MTRYIGLIGYPLGHSVSPPMQQAAFDHYGLDLRYEAWETAPDELDRTLEHLRSPSVAGANVTVPHKEAVISHVDDLDEHAREIGAVNTIVNKGGVLQGHNTDAGGFVRSLREDGGFDPAGKRAVLLGAGGVSRAVGYALTRAGVLRIGITDIIADRAEKLVFDLSRVVSNAGLHTPELKLVPPDDGPLADVLSRCDLLVNCTPLGMKGHGTEGRSPLEAGLIPGQALVYDVVYNPVDTPLLAAARKKGARTVGGLSMLVYQGALAFQLWTGKAPPVDLMMQAARGAL